MSAIAVEEDIHAPPDSTPTMWTFAAARSPRNVSNAHWAGTVQVKQIGVQLDMRVVAQAKLETTWPQNALSALQGRAQRQGLPVEQRLQQRHVMIASVGNTQMQLGCVKIALREELAAT